MFYNEDILLRVIFFCENYSLLFTNKTIYNTFIKNKYIIGKRKLKNYDNSLTYFPENCLEIYKDLKTNGILFYKLETFKYAVEHLKTNICYNLFLDILSLQYTDKITYILENKLIDISENIIDLQVVYGPRRFYNKTPLYEFLYKMGYTPTNRAVTSAILEKSLNGVFWLHKTFGLVPYIEDIAYAIGSTEQTNLFYKQLFKKFKSLRKHSMYYARTAFNFKKKALGYWFLSQECK